MEFKDYYAILGVDKDASADEIKRAYRRLARKYHPDVSDAEDAEARFKDVGEAYEVLKDPEKRAAYDQLHARGGRGFEEFAGNWQFSGGGFTDADSSGFSDFFREIFGGGEGPFARSGFRRARDLRSSVAITLEEAYSGTEQTLELRIPELTAEGARQRRKTLKVRIPAGVTHGQEIRLRGQGEPGREGQPAGDLYVEVRIAPHPHYVLEGRDVHLTVPITPWEAALGAKVQVPTLGGRVEVKVPQGASKVRLRGRGLPGKPAGDQYLHFKVVVPHPQSEAEREHYRALAESCKVNVRQHLEAL